MTIIELEQEVDISQRSAHGDSVQFEDETCRCEVCSEAADHENALNHTPLVVHQFFTANNTPVFTQPLYSSDLTLFPTLKLDLEGTHLSSMEDIESNVMAELRKIPKEPSATDNAR
jgi:hypothetical protein